MNFRKFQSILVAALLFALVFPAVPGLEFGGAQVASANPGLALHVATTGSDTTGTGTIDAPYATLEKARDRIRQVKSATGLPAGGVVVYVRGGEYERTTSFELTAQDSGTADKPIVYTSYPGETATFSGGKRLSPSLFAPVADSSILSRLPQEGRGHVLQANLASIGLNASHFGVYKAHGFSRQVDPAPLELFIDDEAQTLARYPNEGKLPIVSVVNRGSDPRGGNYANIGGTFNYYNGVIGDERPDRWTTATEAVIFGYFYWGFSEDNIPVQSIDPAANTITLAKPHLYGLIDNTQLNTNTHRYYAFNLLEEIDMPGEYFLDRGNGILYVYPKRPLAGAKIQVSVMEAPLFALEGVSHVEVSRFVFEVGRGMGLYMEGGEHNKIAGNTFRHFGTVAVSVGQGALGPDRDVQPYVATPAPRVIGGMREHLHEFYMGNHTAWNRLGGTNHQIVSNDVYGTGAGGIYIDGGDRKTLMPGNHNVENNRITNFNRRDLMLKAGIVMTGVGNRIANNKIYESPANAILLHGNNHMIEKNEMHHLLYGVDDTGAVTMGRNQGEAGNVIRHNYFHHLDSSVGSFGVQGVFLDDGTSNQTVFGNYFYQVPSSVKLHGGKHNTIANNIFIDGTSSITLWLWTMDNWKSRINESFMRARLLNSNPASDLGVNILAPPYSTQYPTLATYFAGNPPVPTDVPIESNVITNNVSYRMFRVLNGIEQYTLPSGGVNKSYTVDPGFVNAAAGNFALANNAVVYQDIPQFQPIPFAEIGLKTDAYRTSLTGEPVVWEYWTGVAGTSVADIPVNAEPSGWMPLGKLEGPTNWGSDYGARVRGYITPPASGSYTFYISGDDNAEFWLSSDANPANKAKIALVTGWTTQRFWTKYDAQRSRAVNLTAGQKYYFEVLHKEAAGGDYMAAGWTGPGIPNVTVIPGSALTPYKGPGAVVREQWSGVAGTAVSAIPLNAPVSAVSTLTSLEGPDVGHNYGARVRGYIVPPASGSYTLYVSGDDNAELWLSTDASPLNKTRIARVPGWTNPRQWNKYPEQQAAARNLVAGQRYYVEILHKQATGGGHVAVGWSGPGLAGIAVVNGDALLPYNPSGNVTLEYWTGVAGNTVAQIPVGTTPAGTAPLGRLETPVNWTDQYGMRIRGYITPFADGAYTLYIASDDYSELWLSTDDQPGNKVLIASVTDWTNPLQWNKYASQQSAPVQLVAGKRYYIEVLHKEGANDDHVEVGWTGLGTGTITVIPGTVLSHYLP
ncbi:hypothetical protein FE782_31195 [Paenibacillus antri]|uniref:PA14 domain-containing protein n=1 Tax=Paenibacillus antri TaxID=2582848 RepID=A0A5R9G6E8_9BACL|nr:PA14 domain-containing protein [Paenibacillus antri]TLS48333.1 hypothetical protein FE782_31195 [Paenibacillus antri]